MLGKCRCAIGRLNRQEAKRAKLGCTKAKLGPIELTVKETETVNVPVWAGVAAIVAGGALLLFGSKKG